MDIITTNKILRDKIYAAMEWTNEDGYWRPKISKFNNKINRIKSKKGNYKLKRPCITCGKKYLKTKMHPQKYKYTRRTDNVLREITNKVYRCDKCHEKYKSRNQYIGGR